MIKTEHIEVYGWDAAIRGMRNPLNSWEKSDTNFNAPASSTGIWLGANDLNLMRRLYKAGTEHRKYLRMITVTMDITAPLYWWKEFDTYKVGTVANSCSTMHKIAEKEFTLDDFSHEHLLDPIDHEGPLDWLKYTISDLNFYRDKYNAESDIEKKKTYWWQMIQLLPSSYNQRRTIQLNYETVVSMIHQRAAHKLDEWQEFVGVLRELPYIKEIMEE